jgi:hypothetical protein
MENDKTDIILTPAQEEAIVQFWNSFKEGAPSIAQVLAVAFPNGETDLRSRECRAVKRFLATRSLQAKNDKVFVKKERIVLTKDQEQYIINHAKYEKPLQMAKTLFNNRDLTSLSLETLAVLDFIKNTDSKVLGLGEDITDSSGAYSPPKRLEQAAYRINRALAEDTVVYKSWEKNAQIRGYLESTIKFCHFHRFTLLCNRFDEKMERLLFENSFLSYIWDKTDLTSEEIDLYIDVCQDIVNEIKLNNEIDLFTGFLEEATGQKEGLGTSTSISEHLQTLRDDVAKNKERRKKLIEMLQGKRADRMDQKRKENASVLNLVEAWQDANKRKQIIEGRKKEKEGLREEAERLNNMDAIKALLAGVSVEDLMA